MMKKSIQVKLVVMAVLVVLAVTLLVQNTAAVSTKLLFVTVTMPRAVLLLVTLGLGFVCGLVAAGIWGKK